MTEKPAPLAQTIRIELIVLSLALVSVALLVFELAAELDPHQQWILERIDLAISVVFLLDFVWRWRRAEDRKQFLRSSWWELLAAIPITTDMARALRAVRLLRFIRIIRLLRLVRLATRLKIVLERARIFGGRTHLVTITTVVGTIVLAGAAAFHYFEFGVNPTVKGFGDSVWWAIITITTVGYGDIYPITTAGRIIATILLVTGLGTFGAWAASVGAWIVEIHAAEKQTESRDRPEPD